MQAFFEFFESIVSFLWGIIEGIIDFFRFISLSMNYVLDILIFLPGYVRGAVLIFLGVSVFLFILNRG